MVDFILLNQLWLTLVNCSHRDDFLSLLWYGLVYYTVHNDLLWGCLWLSLVNNTVRDDLLGLLWGNNLLRLLGNHNLLMLGSHDLVRLLVHNLWLEERLLRLRSNLGLVLCENLFSLGLKVKPSCLSKDFTERIWATHSAQEWQVHERHAHDGCR